MIIRIVKVLSAGEYTDPNDARVTEKQWERTEEELEKAFVRFPSVEKPHGFEERILLRDHCRSHFCL